ncbi:nuclear protein localization protein 4 homolog [Lineus longissimus]|uniref:nuclear protein localization protein 4 homolog n=1 Tax=Lineus longissimus TaxID=88925 RepID=UPI002B4F7FBD
MSKSMIVRVQSPEHGTKRIQTVPSERVTDFLDKIKSDFSLASTGWTIYQNRNKTGEIRPTKSKTLSVLKIKHGDMLYLDSDGASGSGESESLFDKVRKGSIISGNGSRRGSLIAGDNSRSMSGSAKKQVQVIEDEVDQILEKQSGKIDRSKNEQLCRHGPQGKCLHCVPLEPYDEAYLKSRDPPIKFLSFHSYIRKLTGGVDKGKFATLENLSCKIKPGCTEHLPWPGGICTKCQPNAVTLKTQKYRHVDYINFENPVIVERFLNYWRFTGNQRIGILYGRYEPHKDVPLGIKATVAAIYEPPQKNAPNSVELLEDENEGIVDSIAESLGLIRVGWIFTDLVADDLKKGTVKCFRGSVDSHFLSAEECIMAAEFQNKYPNPCKLSSDGHFGSKFVTVLVTGDTNNQIHFEGYQVSDQCMALVRDDCLVPTRDVMELGYVKESTNEQYIPDVFYTQKDKYNNEVTKLARPLPVEYLLVDMPAAFPVEPIHTFAVPAENKKQFPVENRANVGEIQDFSAFATYMHQYPEPDLFLAATSDFHVLIFMTTCDMLPLKEKMGRLCEAVRNKDEDIAYHWSRTEEWQTVVHLLDSQVPSPPVSRQGSFVGPNASPLPPIGSTAEKWTCSHCTFLNPAEKDSCEMCSLPNQRF